MVNSYSCCLGLIELELALAQGSGSRDWWLSFPRLEHNTLLKSLAFVDCAVAIGTCLTRNTETLHMQ